MTLVHCTLITLPSNWQCLPLGIVSLALWRIRSCTGGIHSGSYVSGVDYWWTRHCSPPPLPCFWSPFPYSFFPSHILSHTVAYSLTHTHTHTHKHARTHTHAHTHTHTLSKSNFITIHDDVSDSVPSVLISSLEELEIIALNIPITLCTVYVPPISGDDYHKKPVNLQLLVFHLLLTA